MSYPNSAMTSTGGLIGWNERRRDLRLYVTLSAKALFMQREHDARWLVRSAINKGAKFTRIDIARDDVGMDEGILDLDLIAKKIQRREVVTRWRVWSRIVSGGIQSQGNFFGDTVYLGNRAGESFLRIYNKAGQTGVENHWIRVELELKGDKAVSLSRDIYSEKADLAQILYYMVRFVDKSDTTERKVRWKDSQWWTDFVGTCKGQRLELPRYETGLEDVERWLTKQVAGSLALFEDVGRLDLVMAKGQERLQKDQRLQRLAKTVKDGGLKEQAMKKAEERKKISDWRYSKDLVQEVEDLK